MSTRWYLLRPVSAAGVGIDPAICREMSCWKCRARAHESPLNKFQAQTRHTQNGMQDKAITIFNRKTIDDK